MANTKRRENYIDRNGNMFMPMNIEGGQWNESFFTTNKLFCIGGLILSLMLMLFALSSENSSWRQYAIVIGVWLIVAFYLTRFVIFEEKFYYRMYKELQQHEISTPALFWNIASLKDTDDGAIITYSDARVAIMVKLERDTITGKSKDFKETHYDAVSNFYKEVVTNRYCFVQMNIMEQAGKDPRLNELSKIVTKSDNNNICKLMEMQVGHIKNITHASLYESDYFLFYTTDVSKVDNIIQDISECIFKILDGAYIGYQVLSSKEIVDLVKEIYGVNYFNSTEASLMMFDRNQSQNITPFNIAGVVWDNNYEQDFNNVEISKLRAITSKVIRETLKPNDMALKKTLYRKDDKKKIGIDFSSLKDVQPKQVSRPTNTVKASLDKRPQGQTQSRPVQNMQGRPVQNQQGQPQRSQATQIRQNTQQYNNNVQPPTQNIPIDNNEDNEYIDF